MALDRVRDLKRRINSGQEVYGSWLTFTDPAVAEIAAGTGFDFVVIDGEHGGLGLETQQRLMTALNGSSTVPLVRLAANDPVWAKQALDGGAEGVVVPDVRSAQAAAAVVAACRYPPDGVRGFGPRRAARYGRDGAAYVAAANEALMVVIQIEHREAVEALDAILDVPGIDALMIGPNDLSGSYGRLGQYDDPEVAEAIATILAKAKAAGRPVCCGVPPAPGAFAEARAAGYRMFTVAADFAALGAAFDTALAAAREG
ncbi:MAG: aldolase/citrate lyase family protein [Azospirillaceae bacterium]